MKHTLALAAFGLISCSGQTVNPITAGTDAVALAVCILDHYATDTAAGDTWQQTLDDIVHACGADVAAVTAVLAEHKKASDAEAAAASKAHIVVVLPDAGGQ